MNNQFMYDYNYYEKNDPKQIDKFEESPEERKKNLRLKRAGTTPKEYYEFNQKSFKLRPEE